jgi:DNA-directed RNA polymerase subunit RPC12/RpoP
MGAMPMMLFGFFRGLIGLGILALAIIGVVLLVRNGKSKEVSPPATVLPEEIAEPGKNCRHCGKDLKTDWVACPYCGKKQ